MKVIHFIATNFIGGPEKQILSHLRKLREIGHDSLVVSFKENGGYELENKCKELGIRCELLPAGRLSIAAVLRQLQSIQQTERPSLICAHGYKANFYSLVLKLRTGCKIVGFSRGWTAENLTIKLYGILDKLLIRYSDRIVAVSYSQRRRLRRLFVPERKIRVIQNALIDIAADPSANVPLDVRRQLGLDGKSRLVFSAGRLSPEKGHIDLLEAAAIILGEKRNSNVHFVIAGTGPLEEKLKDRSKKLGIVEHVHFLGFCKNVKAFFLQSDVFALPSLSEGLPNVVLEAMFFRLPVAATKVGGVPELIKDGETGLLAAPRKPMDLALKIIEILDCADLAEKVRRNGFELVNGEFTGERQTRLLLDVYHEVSQE